MSTEWIRKHVKPSLVAKYDREMTKLRGDESHIGNVVENVKKLTVEIEKIETDEERHARILAEDEQDIQYYIQLKNKTTKPD
jgi:hypothetical protein